MLADCPVVDAVVAARIDAALDVEVCEIDTSPGRELRLLDTDEVKHVPGRFTARAELVIVYALVTVQIDTSWDVLDPGL